MSDNEESVDFLEEIITEEITENEDLNELSKSIQKPKKPRKKET